jgi:serine/threonine protein phosphatase PrpC
MSQPKEDPATVQVVSAAVTDRGLNPKRPLNEDSFLADSERGIFAVADGVGGAEAGEVASQTAIEVLDEAFRHKVDGADIEDLMELAIQRANASIHQMAQDNARFNMMATTIVGLHLNGNIATIGHVGDSRLYRLTPAGQLLRETDDHSVVEEEVRAGRMTAEQAANHPSKNVISRALGAEDDVEVDLKVIEVDEGTQFLLCTDGITRHIPDHELRQLLLTNDDLVGACEEMKRRCFERGAEDNLTAVLVSVGTPISINDRVEDVEKTISPETTVPVIPTEDRLEPPSFVPASRKAFPPDQPVENTIETPINIPPSSGRSGVERTMTRLFLFVLLIVALAGAFYAGRRYRGSVPYVDPQPLTETPSASPTPATPSDELMRTFETARRQVDANPREWLATTMSSEVSRQGIPAPLQSSDPSFLYLYGRASLLTGNYEEAARAFEAAISKADLNPSATNTTLRNEATMGLAAVALKSEAARPLATKTLEDTLLKANPSSPLPSASPSISP